MMTIINKIKNILNRSLDDKLTYIEIKNLIQTNVNSTLIDVRSNQEYREGHLKNAINLPIYEFKNNIKYKVQDKSTIIILYCQTEIRSIKAKRILEKMGYSHIYILKGGMDSIA